MFKNIFLIPFLIMAFTPNFVFAITNEDITPQVRELLCGNNGGGFDCGKTTGYTFDCNKQKYNKKTYDYSLHLNIDNLYRVACHDNTNTMLSNASELFIIGNEVHGTTCKPGYKHTHNEPYNIYKCVKDPNYNQQDANACTARKGCSYTLHQTQDKIQDKTWYTCDCSTGNKTPENTTTENKTSPAPESNPTSVSTGTNHGKISNESLIDQLTRKFCRNGNGGLDCSKNSEPFFCKSYEKGIDYGLLGFINGLYAKACSDTAGTMLSNATTFIFSSIPGKSETDGIVCKSGFTHPSGGAYSKYKCVKETVSDSSSDNSVSDNKPVKDPCGFSEEDKQEIEMYLALIDMGKVEIGDSLEYSPKYECDSRFSAKLSTWKSNCVTRAGGEAKTCTANNPGEKAFCCTEKPSEQKSTTDTTPQKTNTENATPSAPESNQVYKKQGPFTKALKKCDAGTFMLYKDYSGSAKEQNESEFQEWKNACTSLANCRYASEMTWKIDSGDKIDTYTCVPKLCLRDFRKTEDGWCEQISDENMKPRNQGPFPKNKDACYNGPFNLYHYYTGEAKSYNRDELKEWKDSCKRLADCKHASKMTWDVVEGDAFDTYSCVPDKCLPDWPKKENSGCEKSEETNTTNTEPEKTNTESKERKSRRAGNNNENQSETNNATKEVLDKINAAVSRGVKPGNEIDLGSVASDASVISALAKWEKSCTRAKVDHAHKIEPSVDGTLHSCKIIDCDKGFVLNDNQCTKDSRETSVSDAAQKAIDNINASINHGVQVGSEIKVGDIAKESDVAAALDKWEKACRKSQKPDGAKRIDSIPLAVYGRQCVITSCDEKDYTRSSDNLSCVKKTTETNETEETKSRSRKEQEDKQTKKQADCTAKGGELKSGLCYCDGTILTGDKTCEDVKNEKTQKENDKNQRKIDKETEKTEKENKCEKEQHGKFELGKCLCGLKELSEGEDCDKIKQDKQDEKQKKKDEKTANKTKKDKPIGDPASDEEVQEYLDEIDRILGEGVKVGEVINVPNSFYNAKIHQNPKLASAYKKLETACNNTQKPAHAKTTYLIANNRRGDRYETFCAVTTCDDDFIVDDESETKCISVADVQKKHCLGADATYNNNDGTCYCHDKLWAYDDSGYWNPNNWVTRHHCDPTKKENKEFKNLCKDHGGTVVDKKCYCTSEKKKDIKNSDSSKSFNPETHKCTADKEIVELSDEETNNSNQNETSDKEFLSDVDKIINAYKETVQKIKQTGDDE